MCYDAGVGKYPIMGGRYTMDTYPRLAKELDLAWAPDKTRILLLRGVAQNDYCGRKNVQFPDVSDG